MWWNCKNVVNVNLRRIFLWYFHINFVIFFPYVQVAQFQKNNACISFLGAFSQSMGKKAPRCHCLKAGSTDVPFPREREKDVLFVMWQKEPKTQKREGGFPFPFQTQPLWQVRAKQTFWYALGLQKLQDVCKTKRNRPEKQRQIKYAEIL